jgi:hypothetical protein
MKNYIVNAIVALLLIIGVGVVIPHPQQSNVSGGLSDRDVKAVSLAVSGSGVGTKVNELQYGTCYIDPYAATITASTTASVSCQGTLAVDARAGNQGLAGAILPGVTRSSSILAQLSTTTAGATVSGLRISGASASTTAGYIELRIVNGTGTTYTWPTTLGTASGTVQYLNLR